MSADELKELLNAPLGLFALMLLASIGNGVKQLAVVKQTGEPMYCLSYFLTYWPSTLGMICTNVLAFAILVLTDQLNLASAIGIGYGVNSLVDLVPASRRSKDLKATPDSPGKVPTQS